MLIFLRRHSKFAAQILPWGIILSGIAVRVAVYLQNRSLFLDEANLARNIAEKSIPGFFQPLDYHQYAPPLFLLLEKLNFWLLGSNEMALRFLPLISGIALLVIFYLVLAKLVEQSSVFWYSLFLIAFSFHFIRYATEIKQYSTDAAVSLLLIYAALRLHPAKWDLKMILTWFVIGSVAVWLSMPAVFILFGIGCLFLLNSFKTRDTLELSGTGTVIGSWLISFGSYYRLILSQDLDKAFLLDYHAPYFLPFPPLSMEDFRQLGDILLSILNTAGGFTTLAYIFNGTLLLLGAWSFWKQDKGTFVLLTFPVVSCFAASALGLYSLMPRLSLFFIPLLLLLIAGGASWLWQLSRWPGRIALTILLLAVASTREGYRYLYEKLEIEEVRMLAKQLVEEHRQSDLIFVHNSAVPAIAFYTQHHDLKERFYFENLHLAAWNEDPVKFMQTYSKSRRIWIVYSHLVSERQRTATEMEREYLMQNGRFIKRLEQEGAISYLFELDR